MEPGEKETDKPCPNDTDGDGNCGKPACPHCGKFRRKPDIEKIPAPQAWEVTTY